MKTIDRILLFILGLGLGGACALCMAGCITVPVTPFNGPFHTEEIKFHGNYWDGGDYKSNDNLYVCAHQPDVNFHCIPFSDFASHYNHPLDAGVDL